MFQLPFLKGILPKWLGENHFNNDIQKYVQEMMEQSITSSIKDFNMMGSMHTESEDRQESEDRPESEVGQEVQVSAAEPLQATTFESLDHVYVKILITDESQLSQLKVYHNSNQMFIEGIPDSAHRSVITLPTAVKMKDSVSEYRDSYFQIKMKKRDDPQYTEIAVPPLES